jgi:hypothetical protein
MQLFLSQRRSMDGTPGLLLPNRWNLIAVEESHRWLIWAVLMQIDWVLWYSGYNFYIN